MPDAKNLSDRTVAYFSMEIGLHPDVPTYSGGLGMLAGDTLRSAADLHVPLVAVTLLHRKGYFFQTFDESGWQVEHPVNWVVEDFLIDTGASAAVSIEGRTVQLRAWRYDTRSADGFVVPTYLLDADLPDNSPWDRTLTGQLCGGDEHYRLCQEVILGIGGIRVLRALGFHRLTRYHMNEGHAALLTLELLRERRQKDGRADIREADIEEVHSHCVFTTHTPVPAGHDRFDLALVDRVLGDRKACGIHDPICHEDKLNMTYLALSLSHYINGVAKRHGDISRHMFAEYKIDSITNGVHAATWVSPAMAALFDRFIAGWRQDNFSLRYALSIPDAEIHNAHQQAKAQLIEFINRQTNAGFDPNIFTLGFARRAATYKRGDMILDDVDRLRRIAGQAGKFQLVFAGKAHPADREGKLMIQRIIQAARKIDSDIRIVYLPNYDMALGRMMTSGVDVWLNTPQPPLEASGTSGMKAAINGVPSLSVLDGWWIEGCIEGITGWAIGHDDMSKDRTLAAQSLYDKLEQVVIPLYYGNRSGFINIMRHAVALNGSFFNTQRMVQQYVLRAYFE